MKTNDTSILTVKKLTAGYSSHVVLEDVSFELAKGEVLGIIGQNGSGKSTLLKAMSGLIPLKDGYIIVNGERRDRMISHRLLEIGISYFTQSGLVMPALSVEEHISLAHFQAGNANRSNDNIYDQFPKLYKLKDQRAGSLSGGERQMLSFAILLTQQTNTWFLDEPTAGLSPENVEKTVLFLQRMNQEKNISMLLIEHNMEVAFNLATNIAITKEKTLTEKFGKKDFKKDQFLQNHVYN